MPAKNIVRGQRVSGQKLNQAKALNHDARVTHNGQTKINCDLPPSPCRRGVGGEVQAMQPLLHGIVTHLKPINGIAAIVLGGSRARGLHTDASDYDIGIYYSSAEQFDIAALNQAAQALDDEHRANLCTSLGGWGPWVIGGGWLRVDGVAVDLIYRDIQRVRVTIADCREGKLVIGMQAGHPFGFVSSIYMGEVATCQILWDPNDVMRDLKAKTHPYPAELKKAVFHVIGWEPSFCADLVEKGLLKGDAAYVAGCAFRAVTGLLHTLAAINETYVLNEKGLTSLAEGFTIAPRELQPRINQIFSQLSAAPVTALASLRELIAEVNVLRDAALR
jgi:predicted nucleotidyltransferase